MIIYDMFSMIWFARVVLRDLNLKLGVVFESRPHVRHELGIKCFMQHIKRMSDKNERKHTYKHTQTLVDLHGSASSQVSGGE